MADVAVAGAALAAASAVAMAASAAAGRAAPTMSGYGGYGSYSMPSYGGYVMPSGYYIQSSGIQVQPVVTTILLKQVEINDVCYEWKKRSDSDEQVMLYIEGQHYGNWIYKTKTFHRYKNGRFTPIGDIPAGIPTPPGYEKPVVKPIESPEPPHAWKI